MEELESLQAARIVIVVQYLGGSFHGWQRQPDRRTVQGEIEDAIALHQGRRIVVHGAGRTDAGVHAAAQVAHFDVASPIPPHKWATVLNNLLPEDVLILGSAEVPPTWHARFAALWRRYRYTLYVNSQPNLFVAPFCWHYYHEPLAVEKMQAALEPLLGHHDLRAFHRSGSKRPHSWVEMQVAECRSFGDFIAIEVQASGFLYGMVRLIVGMLVEVGTGKRSPQEFTDLWVHGRRDLVKYAAPAKGLCLLRVGYPWFPLDSKIWFDTQPKFDLANHSYCSDE